MDGTDSMIPGDSGENSIETMGLDAGRLCLDFANTANWHDSEQPVELLTDYDALITFGRRTGGLNAAEARRLQAEARRRPAAAAAAVARAIQIREAIYGVFASLAGGEAPPADELTVFNGALAEAMSHARIAPAEDGFQWDWAGEAGDLSRVWWGPVRSAAELLASEERARVGQCADDRGCGWLFLDMSRNHSRRWCDMNDCGNRAKARRHHQKQQAERAGAGAA
jgi:predicted RNA-binding Zn ribbon-like protein